MRVWRGCEGVGEVLRGWGGGCEGMGSCEGVEGL